MRKSLSFLALVALFRTVSSAADSAPALEWVKALPGSGVSSVTAAAADASGNLYIVGTTSSIDFPAAAAAQPQSGSSPLVRINTATGVADKLHPPGLSALSYVTADPRQPRTLYASVANGIFRSLDAGSTWSPLALLAANATVYSLAVDPFDSNTLYAAAGTPGIFKSVDGGVTWSTIDNGITPRSDGAFNAVELWLDPNTPQVLFAYLNYSGLIRSADGGASWSVITSPSFSALAFDPFVPGAIYMAGTTGFLKSTDDGRTFAPLSKLPDPLLVAALIADPLHPGVLFATAFAGGIFQSTDSGATWTRKGNTQTTRLAADPIHPVIYATDLYGIFATTDAFATSTPIGPPLTQFRQLVVAGDFVFEVVAPTTDIFAVKFDGNGNVVYATYFGGSASDSASALAVGSDGALYVTGVTASVDFPTTAGAYSRAKPAAPFVFKLNPDGSLAWSTDFADLRTTVNAIAVDSAGNPFIAGATAGNLPTTPGAYQTQFTQSQVCTGFIGCFPGPTSAFVAKFNAQGTGLLYSTYIPTDPHKNIVSLAQTLAVDSNGNAYFAGNGNIVVLNSAGSALLASVAQNGIKIAALALDSNSNLYVTGAASPTYTNTGSAAVFPATLGAFQTAPQPAFPGANAAGYSHAFVIKWDGGLSHILAATLLGGELPDAGESIALDRSGNVILSGETDSKAFPTHAPFQLSFSVRTGFVAAFDPSLSQLLFSTYLGDEHPFDARAAALDSQGSLLLAGSTLATDGFPGGLVVANKIALPAPPTVRLDSVVNAASRMAVPIAPGEPIVALGSGFGPDARFVIDGAPLAATGVTGTTLTAIMPDNAKTSGASVVQVSSGGALSNPIAVSAAPASPGIYSVDGSGFGQAHILNSDGTLNSPANPAAPGSAITIYATGAGAYTLDHGYTVTALAPSVVIGGFYADGIAAVTGPVAGFPGSVYQLSVYVPDPAKFAGQNPNLKDFKFPPQTTVRLVMGPVNPAGYASSAMVSQPGLVINIQ